MVWQGAAVVNIKSNEVSKGARTNKSRPFRKHERDQEVFLPTQSRSRSIRAGLSQEQKPPSRFIGCDPNRVKPPGIGPIVSSAMVAAIGTGDRFSKGRDFAAWLGLVPRQISTGDRTDPKGEHVAMQSIGHDRREFIAKSFCVAGAAGLGAFDLLAVAAQAQTPPRPIRRSERYDNSFITERKALQVAGQQHACGVVRA